MKFEIFFLDWVFFERHACLRLVKFFCRVFHFSLIETYSFLSIFLAQSSLTWFRARLKNFSQIKKFNVETRQSFRQFAFHYFITIMCDQSNVEMNEWMTRSARQFSQRIHDDKLFEREFSKCFEQISFEWSFFHRHLWVFVFDLFESYILFLFNSIFSQILLKMNVELCILLLRKTILKSLLFLLKKMIRDDDFVLIEIIELNEILFWWREMSLFASQTTCFFKWNSFRITRCQIMFLQTN